MNTRRDFLLAALAGSTLSACQGWGWRAPEKGPVACLFPGPVNDGGRLEAAYSGLRRLHEQFGMEVVYREATGEDATAVLRDLAASDATLVLAFGPEAGAAVLRIAAEFPQQRFSVIEAPLAAAANVAVYRTAEEQVAWLAGAAAALQTKSRVIGHIGMPGGARAERLRRAYVAGAAVANRNVRVLSRIVDTGDPVTLAQAQFKERVDVLYAALDHTPETFIDACARLPLPLIGHGKDWTQARPQAFVASAVADPGEAVFQAGRDLHDALWRGNIVHKLGVGETESTTRLALSPQTSAEMREQMDVYRRQIASGAFRIPE